MERCHIAVATGLAAVLFGAAAVRAEPSIYPTGVTRYDPAKAYDSFILFSGGDDKTHLIDMDGREIHRWNYPGFPSGILDPSLIGGKRGRVVVELSMMRDDDPAAIPKLPFIYRDKSFAELDWNGKIVWQWGNDAPGSAAQQHHDWSLLPNGDWLVLSVLVHPIPGFGLPKLVDDAIYEVTPAGKIVWRWIAGDHLDEFGFSPEALALLHKSKALNYLTLNDMKPVGPNHWFREGDARFSPHNIIIGSRNANFVAIIDKATGRVVWRLALPMPPRRQALAVCRR